jgi:hypothetical protein
MAWLKIDDEYPGHRKMRRRSDGAFRLHTTALCACAHDLTDGKVTREDIEDMAGINQRQVDRRIAELVRAELWQKCVEDGANVWWIHDYLDYNPSRAEVMASREQARIRQQKWKERRSEQNGNAVTNALPRHLQQHPDPTRPDPYPLSTSVETPHQSLRNVPRKAVNE